MRIWLKPDRMAALGIAPSQVREALAAQQLPVGGRADQGLDGLGQPRRQHRPAHAGGVPAAGRQASRTASSSGSATSPTSCSAPRTTSRTCASTARRRRSWASGCCPTRNSLDVIAQGPRGDAADPARSCRPGMKVGIAYDSTEYIQDAIDEVLRTLTETLLIVIVVIFLFLGSFRSVLIPVVAIPVSLDRRRVPDAGRRLHGQPADAARHRALGRPRRRRRDRDGGERRAPPARGQAADAGGDRRRARAGRADHRDDHHAGRGLRADRHPGRPDRRAVPRVRVHAGGRGDRLGRRGADAVADDVGASCCAPATPTAGSPAGSTAASTACGAATRARWRRRCATGRSC